MKTLRNNRGFTLIELLVVVAIIALLIVGVAPHLTKALLKAKANTSAQTCDKLYKMLNAYAIDRDQTFPTSENSSNEAFRELFRRGFVDDEKVFFLAGSAWHNGAPGKKQDNDEGTQEDGYANALTVGENHYAYVSGLTLNDDTATPLVADGFSEQTGVYDRDASKKGGIWKGLYAAVARSGGNATLMDLEPDLTVKEKKGESKVDIFSPEFLGTTAGIKVLNPEG